MRLFHRSSTPVTLTPAGTYYLNVMHKIYVQEQRLRNEIKCFSEERRMFTIGMSTLRAKMWLPHILPEFCARRPELSVCCRQGGDTALEEMVQQGKVDVVLGALNPGFSDLEYRTFPHETLQWVVPREAGLVPEEALAGNSPRTPFLIEPGALEGCTLLAPEPQYGFYVAARRMLDQYGVYPVRTITCSNPETNYQLAAQGLGVTVSTAVVLDSIYPHLREKLAFCTFTDPPARREGLAAWRPDCANLELVEDFVETAARILFARYPDGT